jgi:predicted DNA-binding protein (UPF0251 family)
VPIGPMNVFWPILAKEKKAFKVLPGKAVTCEEVLWLQDLEKMEKEQARQKLLIEKATVGQYEF